MRKLLRIFFLLTISELSYAHFEQHIVVVTLMYNCEKECCDSLRSIFDQNYSNYHLILIDDCSKDNTAQVASQYIDERGMQARVHFIRNSVRQDITANHRCAVSLCGDNDIVVHLDGDGDAFAHPNVLSFVNKLYTDYPQAWMTYGSFVMQSTGKRPWHGHLPQDVLRNRTIRSYDFVTSHLRTFRAWLFKQIKDEDFFYNGSYHVYAADLTFLFPMIEMAGDEHVRYVEDILYIYKDHPTNTDMGLYHQIVNYFRRKSPYPALKEPALSK